MKNVVFTICANNYLAQALTLKKSIKEQNPEVDFYIFLSDKDDGVEIENLILLNDSWIPGWEKMAFKYNVIEFSTSIKPYCIKFLFKAYQKVVYLDPDTYVVDSLDVIFDGLGEKQIIITPHYCNIQENFTGAVPEEEILFVGIYNLGFIAINNSQIGNRVNDWWINRLTSKCYADKFNALHVDQKWFDFIPAFFPNDTLISHHLGLNVAIWNLHERELVVKDDLYYINSMFDDESYPLIFFHFSGFNPTNQETINWRHPTFNIYKFPSFKPIIKAYTKELYEAGYNHYSKLQYGFNSFSNSERIIPLHRRFFRELESELDGSNPFESKSAFYMLLQKNKLLTGKNASFSTQSLKTSPNSELHIKILISFMRFFKGMVGIKIYSYFLRFFSEYYRYEKHVFLIKKVK